MSVDLDVSGETENIGQAAKDELIKQVMAAQSAEIDGVSGATITSNAVKTALKSCIAQAKGETIVAAGAAKSAVESTGSYVLTDITAEDINASAVVLEPITNFAETVDVDVVVCGAGAAGVTKYQDTSTVYTGIWRDGTQSYDFGEDKVEVFAPWFGPKPNNYGTLVSGILADAMESNSNLTAYFSTPVVQLIQEGGAVVGWYCQIFDSDYMSYATGGVPEVVMARYLKEEDPAKHVGVFPELIDTFRADTIEELAKKLGLPVDATVASVNRYNELCEKGEDTDFGKKPEYLHKFDHAPFWGIRRHIRCSSITAGVLSDEYGRVTTEKGDPIKGLYAVGNLGGQFYGAPDYPFFHPGLSLGHAVTFGYIAGEHAAQNR